MKTKTPFKNSTTQTSFCVRLFTTLVFAIVCPALLVQQLNFLYLIGSNSNSASENSLVSIPESAKFVLLCNETLVPLSFRPIPAKPLTQWRFIPLVDMGKNTIYSKQPNSIQWVYTHLFLATCITCLALLMLYTREITDFSIATLWAVFVMASFHGIEAYRHLGPLHPQVAMKVNCGAVLVLLVLLVAITRNRHDFKKIEKYLDIFIVFLNVPTLFNLFTVIFFRFFQ